MVQKICYKIGALRNRYSLAEAGESNSSHENTYFCIFTRNRARYKKNREDDFCSRKISLSIAFVKPSFSVEIFSSALYPSDR